MLGTVTLPAIETRGLGKRYGTVSALTDLSLRIEPGEIFGFLGPNGAGKTTTIRLLLGLIAPTSGEAFVLGRPSGVAGPALSRAELGYLPGELALWPSLSGARTLTFLEQLAGRPATRRAELLDRLQFAPRELARRVRTYSDGMKQKLGIVQALQCDPRVVLLDEPTKGLDPLMQHAFYDLLLDLSQRGTTVFFSSHVLPEIERVCHRVAMLRGGRLVSVGDVDEIRRVMPRRVTLIFSGDVDTSRFSALGDVIAASSRRIELLVATARLPELVRDLAGLPLADVVIESPSFEAAFLERYR
jgi:ABC-2 type transport system ATP-binding protein